MSVNNEYAGNILKRIFENGVCSDQITLISEKDNQRTPIHRAVLTAASKYYSAALGPNFLEGQKDEFILKGTDGRQVKAIVDFCYTGRIDLTDENVAKYLDIASRFGFDLLEKECWQLYADKLSVTNSVETLVIADKYSNADLRQRALDLISESFEMVPTADILELDHRLLLDVLKSDKIQAAEGCVFKRLQEWFQNEEDERTEYMPELLKLVRLELISPQVFNDTALQSLYTRFACSDLFIEECKRRASGQCSNIGLRRSHSIFCLFAQYKEFEGAEQSAIKIEKFNSVLNSFEETGEITLGDRIFFGMVLQKNKIYVLGGRANGVKLKSASAYALHGGEETVLPEMNLAREKFAWILFGKYIYDITGPLNACERFDTETKRWNNISPMNVARYFSSVAIVNGNICVAGGQSNTTNTLNAVELYDPKSDKWVQLPPMNIGRVVSTLFNNNGFLYAIGLTANSERYDPWQMCWSEFGSFAYIVLTSSAILNDGGIVAITRNGAFGRITFDGNGDCSFVPLAKSNYEAKFMYQQFLCQN